MGNRDCIILLSIQGLLTTHMGTIFVCSNGMLFVESSAKTAAHVADIFLAVAMKFTEPALAEHLPQSVQALPGIAGDGDVRQS